MTHPTYRDFHPVHHPSYIDFFEQVLAGHHRPGDDVGRKWEKQYAEDEWYRHLYRTGNAYHGVHPFYAWYWGAHGLQHAGKVIIVGGDPPTVRRLGLHAGVDDGRRVRDRQRRRGSHPHHQPPARPRPPGGRRPMSSRTGSVAAAVTLRHAARVVDAASAPLQAVLRPTRTLGFPYRVPTVSTRREVPPEAVRRSAPTTTPTGPARHRRTQPGRSSPAARSSSSVHRARRPGGARRRPPRRPPARSTSAPPVIFAPNHHSHSTPRSW